MPEPRVAVIVPCYNDGATVVQTVESVRAQEPSELVIVDDGSTDEGTREVLDRLEAEGVRVIHQENRGLSGARMTGVGATSARYVFPIDADDEIAPGALQRLADALDANPDYAAAFGDVIVFGDAERYKSNERTLLDPWRITYFNGLPYASLFRRTALEAAGGWELHAGGYEDWDLWMSLAERGERAIYAGGAAMRYRIHGERMWSRAVELHDQIVEQITERHAQLFARRRANWRASKAPWRHKLLMPVVDRLPLVSVKNRRRLMTAVYDPGVALGLAARRLHP